MAPSTKARLVKIIAGLEGNLADHAQRCSGWIVGFLFSRKGIEELQLCELWGLPVLCDDDTKQGRVFLLCEACGDLQQRYENVEDALRIAREHPDRGRFNGHDEGLAA